MKEIVGSEVRREESGQKPRGERQNRKGGNGPDLESKDAFPTLSLD